MNLQEADFKAWFPEPDGFPRPDWKAIGEWIRANVTPDKLITAWQEIARIWLDKLCAALGRTYAVVESENFHLVSELDEKERNDLLSFLERARARILWALADIPLPTRYGKHVVLRFTNSDDYYRYLAYFHRDGEHATSGGVFFRRGYMHIVYPHDDVGVASDRRVLAHELTHNLLRSFPLPAWLSESLAMLFERDVAGGRQPPLTREMAADHRAYWTGETIQEFWRGVSFGKPDGQKLAYSLAGILLDFVVTDIKPAPPDFRDFVMHADRKDAGQAAARDFLGVELSDLVSAFLGPGEWGPRLDAQSVVVK
jgi:hypothetical protein